jgi:hypothetical protein
VLTIKRLRESGKHSRLLVCHNPSQLQQADRFMARKRQALKVVDRRIIVNGKKCDREGALRGWCHSAARQCDDDLKI